MTVERHFAFFDQRDGRWIREWRGLVKAPPLLEQGLSRRCRQRALETWMQQVSGVCDGEIGLDVTYTGWPVGDFIWSQFDALRMRLEWPERHAFLIVDRETLQVVGHTESPRPVRSTAAHVVIDVTGTVLASSLYQIQGRFLLSATGAARFLSTGTDPVIEAWTSVGAAVLLRCES